MSKSSLPPRLDPPPRIKPELSSPEVLHGALLAIEEKLQNMQGQVRDLLWEEKLSGSGSCQLQLDRLTCLIGEWEMAAIRTQWELEIVEGRSRSD